MMNNGPHADHATYVRDCPDCNGVGDVDYARAPGFGPNDAEQSAITYRADGRGGWVGSATHGPVAQPDRPELYNHWCCKGCDGLTAVLRQHLAAEAIVRGTR